MNKQRAMLMHHAQALVFLCSGFCAHAQTIDPSWVELFPDPDEAGVMKVDETNGVVYLAGTAVLGDRHESGAVLDPLTGLLDMDMPAPDNTVLVALADGEGGFFIGGDFLHIGDVPRMRLAHVSGTGAVLPLAIEVDAAVFSLELVNDTLFIGGMFTTVNGSAHRGVAAIDLVTNTVLQWNPGVMGNVYAISVYGPCIYLGGAFPTVGGQTRRNLVRFARNTGTLLGAIDASNAVRTITPHGDKVFVGGPFGEVGGQNRSGLAALNASTGGLSPWLPPAGFLADVRAIEPMGDTLFVAGGNVQVNLQPRGSGAAMLISTSALLPWDPGCDRAVHDMERVGNTIYMVGDMRRVQGQWRSRLAAVDATTAELRTWDPVADRTLSTIAYNGNALYVGGGFKCINGLYFDGLAAVDIATGRPTGWRVDVVDGVSSTIDGIAATDNEVCIVGMFDQVQGQPRRSVAVLDRQTGALLPYTIDVARADAVIAIGDTFYVGGFFSTVNDTIFRNNLLAFNADDGTITAWGPGTNSTVHVMLQHGEDIILGGIFTSVNGNTRNRLAAVSVSNGSLRPLSLYIPDDAVYTLGTWGDVLYFAGPFDQVNTQPRSAIAAVDLSTGLLLPWQPDLDFVPGVGSILAESDGVYLGLMEEVAMVKLDHATGALIPWDGISTNGFNYSTRIERANDHLVVCGSVRNIFGSGRNYFAATGPSIPTSTNTLFRTPDKTLLVAPVPSTHGNLRLTLPFDVTGAVRIELRNHLGQLVSEHYTMATGGLWHYPLNLPNSLAMGLYHVDVHVAGSHYRNRVILE